jgi:hypothetical protein
VKKQRFILDRFEGDKAVLVCNAESIIVPAEFLSSAKEGDAVTITFEFASGEGETKKVKKLLGDIFENRD